MQTETTGGVMPKTTYKRKYFWARIRGYVLDDFPQFIATSALDAIARLVILAFVGGAVMAGAGLFVDAPGIIGRLVASSCLPGRACDFATAYGGFGLGVFLLVGTLWTFTTIGFSAFQRLDQEDENIQDLVLEDLEIAGQATKHPGRLTAADITRRTGLERTVVQQCLECLIEDGLVIRATPGSGLGHGPDIPKSDKSPQSSYIYRLRGSDGPK